MRVPPRFSRRSTRRPVCASTCWESSSARMICSVKFFDPATTVFGRTRRQPAIVATPPPSSVSASLLVRRAVIFAREVEFDLGGELLLDQPENQVHANGQQSRGNRAGKDDGVTDHSHSPENKYAQSTGANGSRDGGDAYADDHGHTHSGKNYRHR